MVMISKSSLYVTIDTKFYENIVFFSHKLMLLFIIKSTELMSTFSVWQIKSQVTLRNWVFLRIELQGTKLDIIWSDYLHINTIKLIKALIDI